MVIKTLWLLNYNVMNLNVCFMNYNDFREMAYHHTHVTILISHIRATSVFGNKHSVQFGSL